MNIVILDFTDGKVKVINNMEEGLQVEEVEILMYEKYWLSTSNIEYMIVQELEVEILN